MLIVGLTGSIGMGKSTAAARFREHGIAVFDADAEVHKLYDGPMAAEIEQVFPGTSHAGKVDRARLSALLMKEPEKLGRLESIVHPRVRAAEQEFLRREAARGAQTAVLEIPLLFESGAEKLTDVVIVVSAPAEIQRARVMARQGMTEAKYEKLLQRQLADGKKRDRADFVVDTGGSVEASNAQIDVIVERLRGRKGLAFERHWK